MQHPDHHHLYYLIKTADPNFSIVISEIEENSELKNLLENKSKQNLTALFFELYSVYLIIVNYLFLNIIIESCPKHFK